MAPRIGMINIGHPDYPNDVGARFAEEAASKLRDRGVLIITDEQAYTEPIAAMQRGQEMVAERLDGVIVWLGTWIECSTALAAIREFEHLPFAIWGFNMYEEEGTRQSTGSFVAACVLKGALDRMGYPFKTILGMPDDEAALKSATAFARAAHTIQRLKRTRLGLVGYAAMSMYPGTFDHVLMRRIIGPEVVQFDTYTLVRMAEAVTHTEAKEIADEWASQAEIAVANDRLMKAAKLGAALRKLVDQHKLNALNVKCQYELSQEWGMTPCVPLSWLADQGIVTACEGDVPVTVTACLLSYLAGETVTYGDILDLRDGQMLLSACGFAPFSLADERRPHPPAPSPFRRGGETAPHPPFDVAQGQPAPSPSRNDCSGEGEHGCVRICESACGFAPFSLADERRPHPPAPSPFRRGGETAPHPPAPSPSRNDCSGEGEQGCVRICELDYPGFDGIICSCTLKRGPVTFARLAEGRGDYRLIYGTGVGIETELRQGRFPALEVKLDGDANKLLETIASQHWALCYGDVTDGIEDVCRALGVEAVRV